MSYATKQAQINGWGAGIEAGAEGGGFSSAMTSAVAFNSQDMAQVASAWSPDSNMSFDDRLLTTLESDTAGKVVLYGSTAVAVSVGGTVALAPIAAGLVAGVAGSMLGDMAGHALAGALGLQTVATTGDQPATLGHPIVNTEVKIPRSAEVIFPTFGIW